MIRSILRSHLIPSLIPGLILAPLAACGPSYSPNTYSANAAQQANKADQGIIIGVRPVRISATGTVGTVTGAAAGGIAGSENGTGVVSAFSALGGSLVGGLAGSAVEHATSDTDAFEYIVQKKGGDLVSITQKDKVPLALGEKVLVIAGNQARVVPDYTDSQLEKASKPAEAKAANAAPSGAPSTPKTDKPADAAATPLDAAVAGQPTPAEAVPADAAAVGAALSGAKPSSSPSNSPAGGTPSASASANAPTDGLLPPSPLPAGAVPSGGPPAASAAAAAMGAAAASATGKPASN